MEDAIEQRYQRQMQYCNIGKKGQKKVGSTRVLIVGCGAVGTVIANSLTRMGVQHIRLIDDDIVELDNLQRQLLFTEKDAKKGTYKVRAAKRALEHINAEVQIEGIVNRITTKNITSYLENIDIIFDGTDNLSTRFIINSTAITKAIPYVYGAAAGDSGASMLVVPDGPCLNCLLPSKSTHGETAQTAGILNQITMIVGSVESMIGLRYMLGDHYDCIGRLYTMNSWDCTITSFTIKKNPECPVCGTA